jgi:hypothetical protein
MFGDCGGGCCARLAVEASDTAATDATIARHLVLEIFALPFELVIHFQRTVARNLAMKIQSRQRPCATPNALGRRHPLTGSRFNAHIGSQTK